MHSQCCAITTSLSFQNFITPEEHPVSIKYSLLIHPSLHSLTTSNLFSVSMDLPILDVSYKRNHKLCGFQSGFFHSAYASKVHPSFLDRKIAQCYHSIFIFEQQFIVWIDHNLFILLSVNKHSSCFNLLPVMNSAAMDICEKVFT